MCFLRSGYKRGEKKGDAGTNTSVKTYIGWIEGGASQWNGTVMGSEIRKMNPKIPCHRKHRQIPVVLNACRVTRTGFEMSVVTCYLLETAQTILHLGDPIFLFVEREQSKQFMRLKYIIFFFAWRTLWNASNVALVEGVGWWRTEKWVWGTGSPCVCLDSTSKGVGTPGWYRLCHKASV